MPALQPYFRLYLFERVVTIFYIVYIFIGIFVFQVDFSNTSMVLLIFLGVSLASTLVLLLVQRFYVHRWHGAYLLALYVACLVVAVLTGLGVIFKTNLN